MDGKLTIDNQYVLFKLDNEYYGIDILNVTTIEKVMDITRVPNALDYVEGVINLRGEVVPVINMRKRLGLSQMESTDETRVIIISVNDLIVGLLVDASSEVLQLDSSEIEEGLSISDTLKNDYVKGIGKRDNRMIILLNLDRVLELENMDTNE